MNQILTDEAVERPALPAVIASRPWYCRTCDIGVPANWVTPDQLHDTSRGGCGKPVEHLEYPDGSPQAFGVFAEVDGRMVLQWPTWGRLRDAQNEAIRYGAEAKIEIRPLQAGPATNVLVYVEHIERLNARVRELETLLASQQQGDVVVVDRARYAALVEDEARLNAIEVMGNAPLGVLLHRGIRRPEGSPALGLADIRRSLRQAIDHVRATSTAKACRIELRNDGNPAPKTCARCGLGPCKAGTGAAGSEGAA